MPPRQSLPFLTSDPVEARREESCCAPALEASLPPGRLRRLASALRQPRAWAALALLLVAGLAGLGLSMGMSPERMGHELWRNLVFVLRAFRDILPYFVVSVGLSAWAVTSGAANRIRALFARGEGVAIFAAAGAGAVVPLCSCGVIPVIAALLAGGVPLGPVMAFWISAPLMSPEMFTLTAGLLGFPYALMVLASALVIGIGAGAATMLAVRRGLLAGQVRPIQGDACCAPGAGGTNGAAPAPTFAGQAAKSALFLGKWLALAFVLEALLTHYVDPAWIQALLGGDHFWSIPLATAAGIPLYVSGVASIPIVSGLLAGGMSPGAAMAFLVAGPVTTVCAMGAVLALVRRRAFLLYLGSGIAGSLAAGYMFQAIMG